MAKRVLIIGAGIAGLSAASYLRRNGFETEVFEAGTTPGGLCVSWRRNGYLFDGCIHWLMGSGPASNLHVIWRELGAGDLDYVEWSVYSVIRLSDGDSFTVYTDPDKLEEEMTRLSPEDASAVKTLVKAIRTVSQFDFPAAMDRLSVREKLILTFRLPAFSRVMKKWNDVSLSAFIRSLKGLKLREGLMGIYGDIEGFPIFALLMMLGFMAKKSAGYPIGGSSAFSHAIEDKYRALGGLIHYGRRVDQIIVENGSAVGLKGSWGEVRGDYVISAGDAHDLMERLLRAHYHQDDLDKAFKEYPLFPSLLIINLGLNKDYSYLPHSLSFPLTKPLVLEDGALSVNRLSVRFMHFDPSSAPRGKTAATVMLDTRNNDYWTALAHSDATAYALAKDEAARVVIAALEEGIKGITAAVETIDVATPHTLIRYTGNFKGAFEGWMPTIANIKVKMARTIPGINNLFLVGQWLNPGGGLPPCGIDGREIAKKLCLLEGRAFKAEA